MAFLRHRQRAVTAVSPHPGNRNYLIPSRSDLGPSVALSPPVELLVGAGLDNPTVISGSGTTLLTPLTDPIPAPLAGQQGLVVTVPTSATATSNNYELEWLIPPTAFTSETAGNLGVVFFCPDTKVYFDTALGGLAENEWKVYDGFDLRIRAYQNGGTADADSVLWNPHFGLLQNPGYQNMRLHNDGALQTVGANIDWSQPFDRVRIVFQGWNSTSENGTQPATDWQIQLCALTMNGSSEAVALINYDHANLSHALQPAGVGTHELHKAKGVPYSIGVNPGYWRPSAPGAGTPAAPSRPDTMTVAQTQALINDWNGVQITHHGGSGTVALSQASIGSGGLNHPDLRDFIRQGSGFVQDDYETAREWVRGDIAETGSGFTGQRAGFDRTCNHPVGKLDNKIQVELRDAGMVHGRATSWSQDQNRTVSALRPWVLLYPDYFVNPLATPTINNEDNTPAENRFIQDAVATINAAIEKGATIDLFHHRQYASTVRVDGVQLINTALLAGTNDGFAEGDKVIVWGAANNDVATNIFNPVGSLAPLRYSPCHFYLRNVSAGASTLEECRQGIQPSGANTTVNVARVTDQDDGTTLEAIEALLDYCNEVGIQTMKFDDYARAVGLL